MANPSDYRFKNVTQIGLAGPGEQMRSNLLAWLRWGFLSIGAFRKNMRTDLAPPGNVNPCLLKLVSDPRRTANTLWQGFRSDWIWEQNLDYAYQPQSITGIYVNGSFVASNSTGAYQHTVLYPQGEIQFASAQSSTLVVECEHSYCTVQVRRAQEGWLKQLAMRSFRADDTQFTQGGGLGGAWDMLAESRIQLPAVLVEDANVQNQVPLEMGSSKQQWDEQFLLHCIAETEPECRRLLDVLSSQKDSRILTYDIDGATPPLNVFGVLQVGAKTYPEMCAANPWRLMSVQDVRSTSPVQDSGGKLFWATLRYTIRAWAP